MTVRDPWVGHDGGTGNVYHPLSVYSWATDPDHPANKPSCPVCDAGVPVVKKHILNGLNEDNEPVQLQLGEVAYDIILDTIYWTSVEINIERKQRAFRISKSLLRSRTCQLKKQTAASRLPQYSLLRKSSWRWSTS